MRLSAAAVGTWLLASLSQAARIPPGTALQLAQNTRDVNAPPPAFKVQIYPTADNPLDSEQIYRTAVDMMYSITAHRLSETWLDREWESPDHTVSMFVRHHGYGKDPSRLSTQHLIWALNHSLLYMQLQNLFCKTTAVVSWLGTTIGTIDIWPSGPPGLETPGTNTTAPNVNTPLTAQADTTSNNNTTALDFTTFEVTIAYGDTPIPKPLLYLTAIKAMGQACERGITANVAEMTTQGIQGVTWKLLPSSGRTSMQAGWSREAVVRTLASAITDQRFAETFVWVFVDEVPVGIGGFTKAS
ncbi:MAG: hypothetical protein Q9174_003667 [Haloplaca sp. 1 TL-2023]